VLFRERAQLGQDAEVAVHAEHAVRDEELPLARWQRFEDLARGVGVLVWEDLDGRAAEPASVDDARVIQLIRNDHILLGQDRRDGSCVGREAALEHHRRLGSLEDGEPALEFHVNRHGARDRPNRSRADAEVVERFVRAFDEEGMRRQSEVIVRRQVDDRAAVELGRRSLAAFEHTERPEEALGTEGIEFV
jgi:hypothetical protein